jgi:hypothetical protein
MSNPEDGFVAAHLREAIRAIAALAKPGAR